MPDGNDNGNGGGDDKLRRNTRHVTLTMSEVVPDPSALRIVGIGETAKVAHVRVNPITIVITMEPKDNEQSAVNMFNGASTHAAGAWQQKYGRRDSDTVPFVIDYYHSEPLYPETEREELLTQIMKLFAGVTMDRLERIGNELGATMDEYSSKIDKILAWVENPRPVTGQWEPCDTCSKLLWGNEVIKVGSLILCNECESKHVRVGSPELECAEKQGYRELDGPVDENPEIVEEKSRP